MLEGAILYIVYDYVLLAHQRLVLHTLQYFLKNVISKGYDLKQTAISNTRPTDVFK